MKKLMTLLLAAVLSLALISCGAAEPVESVAAAETEELEALEAAEASVGTEASPDEKSDDEKKEEEAEPEKDETGTEGDEDPDDEIPDQSSENGYHYLTYVQTNWDPTEDGRHVSTPYLTIDYYDGNDYAQIDFSNYLYANTWGSMPNPIVNGTYTATEYVDYGEEYLTGQYLCDVIFEFSGDTLTTYIDWGDGDGIYEGPHTFVLESSK